jgi:hypothetical protein
MDDPKSNRGGTLTAGLLLALALAVSPACGSIDVSSSSSSHYEKHVVLMCMDEILVDETFTSREECEAFQEENTFTCQGAELSFEC